jgi:hypothetical protein
MFETYRMLGRAHQNELERMAAPPHGSAVTRETLFVRLLKRISSPHSTHAAQTDQIQRIAPSDAGHALASAASPDPQAGRGAITRVSCD